MLYAMRITLPDRPGTLGSVATALSVVPADIVSLGVVERTPHYAVDEICVEARGTLPDQLREAVQQVDGVSVETVRRIERVPDPQAGLVLADRLARREGPPTDTLVAGLPDALTASWAMIVEIDAGDVRTIAATPGAPTVGRLEAPWLPLAGPRRLEYADWYPPRWKMSRFELAAAPFGERGQAVICGRPAGMPIRPSELRQLELLVGMAVRAVRGLTPTGA